jgi:hypothetical protein
MGMSRKGGGCLGEEWGLFLQMGADVGGGEGVLLA